MLNILYTAKTCLRRALITYLTNQLLSPGELTIQWIPPGNVQISLTLYRTWQLGKHDKLQWNLIATFIQSSYLMSDWQSTLLDATCQANLFVLSTCKYHHRFKRWCGRFRIMTYFDCLSLRIGITSMTMKLWLQPGLQTVSSVTISISECLECTYMYYHAASITHKYLSHIIFDSWSSTRESLGVCTRYIGNKKPIDNDDN